MRVASVNDVRSYMARRLSDAKMQYNYYDVA
jgi:hypothetical protein